MKHRTLEVTFRKGKPFAGYLYLPRSEGARVARTVDEGHGLRVDFDALGAPMGVEIVSPSASTVAALRLLLAQLGVTELDALELAPLAA